MTLLSSPMSRIAILLVLILIFSTSFLFAQKEMGVEVIPRVSSDQFSKRCKKLELGEIVFFLKPDYPPEASAQKLGGKVDITIEIDEIGIYSGIVSAKGDSAFLATSIKAAQKVKFKPTICDGKPISSVAVLTYTFTPTEETESYFVPQKVEEFKDINQESQYYEPIFYLTENYKISFGYADNKFHEEAYLTKGDFAHFLRKTLDLIFERAKFANKDPIQINLIRPYNPFNLKTTDEIKDLNKKLPSTDSALALIEIYKISLVNKDFQLNSSLNITQNDVIEIWAEIFGDEALPIHFKKTKDEKQLMTRGEFALFLEESLRVLTYKVLP